AANATLVVVGDIDRQSLQPLLEKHLGNWSRDVENETPRGQMRSLQIFDGSGTAVHKIFLREESDLDAYRTLVERHTAAPDIDLPTFKPTPPRKADKPDAEIEVTAFRDAWRAMQDTHEFFGLLNKHKVGRHQALRLAGGELAYQVSVDAFRQALEGARDTETDIMFFVSSPGCSQIHTGPIGQVKEMGTWLNVLDPGFNLHLRSDHLHTAWVVRKPTADGIVTSLEIFDEAAEPIAMMFGKRKPGDKELAGWRAIVAELPEIEAAA
ncbi:MAG: ChuX/HutX family heme-like substrate-binding protein, partial [Pseudomonadota bacterium]